MKSVLLIGCCISLFLVSCAPELVHSGIGAPFSLRYGGKSIVQDAQNGTSLNLLFESVEEDSRCPEGANCFWAGRAVIRLDVNGTPIQVTEGMLPDSVQPVFGNYRFTLQSLEPYPKVSDVQSSERKKQKAYRARLLVNYR
jgi:hypothetical protein